MERTPQCLPWNSLYWSVFYRLSSNAYSDGYTGIHEILLLSYFSLYTPIDIQTYAHSCTGRMKSVLQPTICVHFYCLCAFVGTKWWISAFVTHQFEFSYWHPRISWDVNIFKFNKHWNRPLINHLLPSLLLY